MQKSEFFSYVAVAIHHAGFFVCLFVCSACQENNTKNFSCFCKLVRWLCNNLLSGFTVTYLVERLLLGLRVASTVVPLVNSARVDECVCGVSLFLWRYP